MGEVPSIAAARAVPVTVLTGFLGAGKTTLLNRILNGDHGLRIAVLVNDFGAINIDADLVVGIEGGGDIISLANGCVCCNIRDDLLAAVAQVVERPERPEFIVLEASGVAEPSGIAATFLTARLREEIRLDSLMCVMDASQIFAAPETMELKLRQIAFSDLLILNKVDLVDRPEIARIKAWLDDHFHRYRLVEAIRAEVSLEILLAAGRLDAARLAAEDHNHAGHACNDPRCTDHAHGHGHGDGVDHGGAFDTWSYETEMPLSLDALRGAASRLPVSIYRCKGVIHSRDAPDRRTVLQVVGKRADLALDEPWGERTPRTRIVAIGAAGAVDGEALRQTFDGCLAAPT